MENNAANLDYSKQFAHQDIADSFLFKTKKFRAEKMPATWKLIVKND